MSPPLLLLCVWAVALPLVVGLGAMTVRAAVGGRDASEPPSFLTLFLVGLGGALVVVQVWTVFAPGSTAWIPLGLLGLAGLLLVRRRVWAASRRGNRDLVQIAVTLAFAAWLAGTCAGPALNPDNGLYYVQSVRLARDFALVRGVGNLHPLLAFNNDYFLLAALFEHGPLVDHGGPALNGLLLLPLVWTAVGGLVRLIRSQPANGSASPLDLFQACLLGTAVDAAQRGFASPAADNAVLAWSLGLALWVADRRGTAGARWTLFALLGATGFCLKTSLVPAIAAAGFAELWLGLVEPRTAGAGRPGLVRPLVAAACLLIPHVVRSTLLSGFPLFPYPGLSVPTPWTLPHAKVDHLYRYIWDWARDARSNYDPDTSSLRPDWRERFLAREWLNNWGFLAPVILIAVLSPAALVRRLRGRLTPAELVFARLAVATVIGLVCWWFLSPDLRFAGAMPWVLVAGLLATAWPLTDRVSRTAATLVAALVIGGALVGSATSWRWPSGFPEPRHSNPARRVQIGQGDWINGWDQDGCWDYPCGWQVDPRIRTEVPADFGSGFRPE